MALGAAIAISTFFLPGFLVGLFACWHKGILKTFLAHPSVFLLPVFSHFTFVSNSKLCCRGGSGGKGFISFSPKCTAINVGVSVTGILAYYITLPLLSTSTSTSPDWFCSTNAYLFFGFPCSIFGLILTMVATFSNQCNCCKSSCCCSCFNEPFEFGALVTSSPHIPYIIEPDGQLVREEETDIKENKEEEVEMEEESKDSGDVIPSSSSTPSMPCIVKEEETDIEENKEEEVEMVVESKDSCDLAPSLSSTPNMVTSEQWSSWKQTRLS